jgi:hypothetical protein
MFCIISPNCAGAGATTLSPKSVSIYCVGSGPSSWRGGAGVSITGGGAGVPIIGSSAIGALLAVLRYAAEGTTTPAAARPAQVRGFPRMGAGACLSAGGCDARLSRGVRCAVVAAAGGCYNSAVQGWLFAPELQWQCGGKRRILQG